MKLFINKSRLLGFNPENFMRSAGYAHIVDRLENKDSYVRRLSGDHYPRFHVYIKEGLDRDNRLLAVISLHLDQKQASYAGNARHSAEYDGPVVNDEIERLKIALKKYIVSSQTSQSDLFN
jgi:hypothetical protein